MPFKFFLNRRIPKEADVDAVLNRGVIKDILPSKKLFKEHLLSDKQMRMYIGFDATSENLHLGHIQNLLLLEDFRRLGIETIVLFGDFTARIGDPSGKGKGRQQLTRGEIKKNLTTWRKQISPIVRLLGNNRTRIYRNSAWLGKLDLGRFLEISSNITVQNLLERDMFQNRISSGEPIHTHEFLYPLLQGYDSVAMKVDAELCGSDQLFNALAGRTLVKRILDKEKFVISTHLLEDEKTKKMMSKSEGTGVFIDIEKGGAERMFGSIMSVSDGMIFPLMRACTKMPIKEIEHHQKEINKGETPLEAKMVLAEEIIKLFHGSHKAHVATQAKDAFIAQFRNKEIPKNAPQIRLKKPTTLVDFLVEQKIALSNSEVKRKVQEGAVMVNEIKVTDPKIPLVPRKTQSIKFGRKIFRVR